MSFLEKVVQIMLIMFRNNAQGVEQRTLDGKQTEDTKMSKDIKIDAKLIRKSGYWFVTSKLGRIELSDVDEEELNLAAKIMENKEE